MSLPDSRIADTDAAQDDVSLLRNKLRPDIMLVELTREEQATYRNGNSQHSEERVLSTNIGDKRRKIWILEGGYCSDTKYERKNAQKLQQHQTLHHMLTQHGYECCLFLHSRGPPPGLDRTSSCLSPDKLYPVPVATCRVQQLEELPYLINLFSALGASRRPTELQCQHQTILEQTCETK